MKMENNEQKQEGLCLICANELKIKPLNDMITRQANSDRDTLNIVGAEMSNIYTIGIDLEEALSRPGSDADLVLRNHDVVVIPEYNSTVRVMGAVMYPNSVTFKEGRNLKYYIKSAGGFDNRARKNRAFVIYMNGMPKYKLPHGVIEMLQNMED